VVGKSTILGDAVRIPASLAGANDPGDKLQVSLEPDGSPPVVIDVKQQPTTLSQTCPQVAGAYGNVGQFTITGHLDPAVAGETIKIKYTTPGQTQASQTFERSVTTDANGDWTDTIEPRQEAPNDTYGTWKVQSRFEGDATHAGSTAAECSVVVVNDG
jgi:hypothetical protein